MKSQPLSVKAFAKTKMIQRFSFPGIVHRLFLKMVILQFSVIFQKIMRVKSSTFDSFFAHTSHSLSTLSSRETACHPATSYLRHLTRFPRQHSRLSRQVEACSACLSHSHARRVCKCGRTSLFYRISRHVS